jgi:hypothetical protein
MQSWYQDLLEDRMMTHCGHSLDAVFGFPSGKASSFVNGHTLYVDGGITTSL